MKRIILFGLLMLLVGHVNAAVDDASTNRLFGEAEPTLDLSVFNHSDMFSCDECDFRPGTIVVTDISDCRKGFGTTGSSITFPCEIVGYSWDFGDMTTGSGAFVSHEYSSSGTFDVCVTITYVNAEGEECTETICRTIEVEGCVDPCEECDFRPGTIVVTDISDCRKGFATTGSSITYPCEIVGYAWDFGDMGTGSGPFVSHDYSSDGTFDVCVTITYVNGSGEECSETICQTIEVEGCADPCEDCFNFYGIEILDSRECEFELVMDYAATGACGAITIISETWDFGHDGETGSGYYITHSFPGNGTYTVTATIVYETADGHTCTAVQTRDIVVTDCLSCEDCFNFYGIEIVDSRECEFELVMDYAATGACGAITIISETWDFGHDGETGSGYYITHTFPGNGTYTVTATIVFETADGHSCTLVQTRDIEVTDCLSCEDCFNFYGIEVVDSRECEFELVMDYAATGACGAITIISETWDFGHDGETGSGYYTTHTFPGNGTYTVTATIVFETADGHSCTMVRTSDIVVTDCIACEDCFNFYGIEVLGSSGCTYELVMDYAASGECGAIRIISETWDFGYPGGTGSGYYTTHTFPGNGIYTITATIVFETEDGRTCTAVQTLTLFVTDCAKVEGRGQEEQSNNLSNAGDNLRTSTVPNPADDEVMITVSDPTGTVEETQLNLIIFDMNGRAVHQTVITVGAAKRIDVSQLQTGMYLYEIRNAESTLLREKLMIK